MGRITSSPSISMAPTWANSTSAVCFSLNRVSPVDPSLLREGANTVTLTALNGDNDVSVVQTIELHYAHAYAADSNWLRATASSGSELRITGFNQFARPRFRCHRRAKHRRTHRQGDPNAGLFDVAITLSHSGPAVRTVLAFSDDAVSAPSRSRAHTPTFLDDQRAGYDIVIISHPDFVSALSPLARFRESQGHRVALVTTDQIYDEYNNGERSPFAIRSYLNDAVNKWQRKPQSVLFVGDASFDPRDYLGLGDFDFVPTRMIETAAFKTGSDDWFTDFQQTGFATLPTGRLPVRTPADAALLVSKIINYERGAYAGPWNSQAVLISDPEYRRRLLHCGNFGRCESSVFRQVHEDHHRRPRPSHRALTNSCGPSIPARF